MRCPKTFVQHWNISPDRTKEDGCSDYMNLYSASNPATLRLNFTRCSIFLFIYIYIYIFSTLFKRETPSGPFTQRIDTVKESASCEGWSSEVELKCYFIIASLSFLKGILCRMYEELLVNKKENTIQS